jgi:hypothetical protein
MKACDPAQNIQVLHEPTVYRVGRRQVDLNP